MATPPLEQNVQVLFVECVRRCIGIDFIFADVFRLPLFPPMCARQLLWHNHQPICAESQSGTLPNRTQSTEGISVGMHLGHCMRRRLLCTLSHRRGSPVGCQKGIINCATTNQSIHTFAHI